MATLQCEQRRVDTREWVRGSQRSPSVGACSDLAGGHEPLDHGRLRSICREARRKNRHFPAIG